MKLLLDECVPQRLRDDFPDHDVYTAEAAGLLGVKNGALLYAAAAQFDVLITDAIRLLMNPARLKPKEIGFRPKALKK